MIEKNTANNCPKIANHLRLISVLERTKGSEKDFNKLFLYTFSIFKFNFKLLLSV